MDEREQERQQHLATSRVDEGIVYETYVNEDGSRGISYREDATESGAPRLSAIPPVGECLDPREIKVGDRVRAYGDWGQTIAGVDVFDYERGEWVNLYFRTEAERKEQHEQWVAGMRVRREREFEESREQLDADYEALPPALQRRIDKYRANNPRFRFDYEVYEMFVLKEAVQIAEHLRPRCEELASDPGQILRLLELDEGWLERIALDEGGEQAAATAAVREWQKLPYEEQKPVVADGHSGNTFGMACQLAVLVLTGDEEALVRHYGAMAPLVGSDEYGDVPVAAG